MGSFREELTAMKQAQEIDGELYHILAELGSIPEERSQSKAKYEAEKAHLSELEENVKKLQLTQKQKEGELAEKETNVKKLDGQLSQVKTNKEYTALQQEIASLKADNSLLEEEIIRVIDEVEAVHEEVKKENDRIKDCEKEYQSREQELNQKEQTLQKKADELKAKREEAIKKISPDVQSLYERIVQKKEGLALVKITGEVCGACQMQLRPQVLNEIYLGENMVICENCSRILYKED